MFTNAFKNELVSMELIDEILIGEIKSELVDLEVAKSAVKFRLEKFGDKHYPFLINIKTVKHVTKEAREYLASKNGCEKVSASAILINSSITSMLGNFFIKINKPLVPTKLFTDKTLAIQWLSNYIV